MENTPYEDAGWMRTMFVGLSVMLLVVASFASSAASGVDEANVLYVHLMEDGEVVHTMTVREPSFLKKPGETRVVVQGFALRTALVMNTGPYRLNAELPPGLCAADHLVQLTPAGKSVPLGELANLWALETCPGDLREPLQLEARLGRRS